MIMQAAFFKLSNIIPIENAIKYLHRLAEVKQHPLDIQITELDVENRGNNDSALATFYGDLFAMYRKNSDKISSVTFWGVADDYSWLDNGPYNMAYPFLFDKNKNKKPAPLAKTKGAGMRSSYLCPVRRGAIRARPSCCALNSLPTSEQFVFMHEILSLRYAPL